MKWICIFILFVAACLQSVLAQDSLQYRVLLIGDAGELNAEQQGMLQDAVLKNIPGKTIVIFLGDNIYPRGMELPGDKSANLSEHILSAQFKPFRTAGVPVYFVPGNHDWDRSGPQGYKKMLRVNEFIQQQHDSMLQVIPKDACPGPYELVLSEKLVVVAMDSEWWLYPFTQKSEMADCECKTKRDVLGKLNDILLRNKDKLVLFATHHPFNTYGSHGGYYTLKDHIFPLTNLGKNLYIPLPVIGSLYPLLRKAFPSAEDLSNVLYADMIRNVNDVLRKHPNVIHAAGHEHALQLINGAVLELGSGAGSKHTAVKKGSASIFGRSSVGYVIADLLSDNSLRLTYRAYNQGNIENVFTYNRPFAAPGPTVEKQPGDVPADSMNVTLNSDFNRVSRFHRKLLGENYRKVWSMEVRIPVLKISARKLKPKELGGGMQTHSLRLEGPGKKEWVLRSIEKFPDNLLPQALTNTLAADILKDNSTAAFPYAPLTVPVFSDAAGVPHSNPKLVYIAPDKQLGIYSNDFANTISLFEEREPLGKSLSTIKMAEKLKDDNDNTVDQQAYLRARLLDVFLGDWDRHADQWRWIDTDSGKGKTYRPVPRDRDQVFYINQGFFPKLAALPWIMPKFQGFGGRIKNINTFCFNARLIDGVFTNGLSDEDWQKNTKDIVAALSDSVITAALQKLPPAVYTATGAALKEQLISRKNDMLIKMPRYYRFLNKTIDITGTDKNELVLITDTLQGQLSVNIFKLSKRDEPGKLVYSRVLDPAVTNEIRLYLQGGSDSVRITNSQSPIRIRIVGDAVSAKRYALGGSTRYLRKIDIYDGPENSSFSGSMVPHRHLASQPGNTELQLTNRYNKTIPLLITGFNLDDGFVFGGGVKWIRQGFRKAPYASAQQVTLAHSFSTNAFRFVYRGEWIHAVGKADFLLLATANAPENTQNFFGRGNGSPISKSGDYKRYYRARFSLYNLAPALRWRSGKANSIVLGPTLQYYRYSAGDNINRLIADPALIHSYDSATIGRTKAHAGLSLNLINDTRDNTLLPRSGAYLSMRVQAAAGLNSFSSSFGQLVTEMAVYRSIGRKQNIVLANRLGGGISAGHTTFYQSLFLGGHENLLGYHQYRFAGDQLLYNNLEARIKLANLASYILPGQLGLVGFYDIGKVWQKGYNSATWHQGAGGGIYFAPAQVAVVQLLLGSSGEGLYPYFTMGFRF